MSRQGRTHSRRADVPWRVSINWSTLTDHNPHMQNRWGLTLFLKMWCNFTNTYFNRDRRGEISSSSPPHMLHSSVGMVCTKHSYHRNTSTLVTVHDTGQHSLFLNRLSLGSSKYRPSCWFYNEENKLLYVHSTTFYFTMCHSFTRIVCCTYVLARPTMTIVLMTKLQPSYWSQKGQFLSNHRIQYSVLRTLISPADILTRENTAKQTTQLIYGSINKNTFVFVIWKRVCNRKATTPNVAVI